MPASSYSFLYETALSPEDFVRFSQRFSQILLSYIPTAQGVEFLIYTPHSGRNAIDPAVLNVVDELFEKEQSFGLFNQAFYLLYKLDHCFALAIVRDIDSVVLERSEKNWLGEVWEKTLHSWQNERQNYIDQSTNLLNLTSLKHALKNNKGKQQGLFLVDLPQSNKNSLLFLNEIALNAQILGRQNLGVCQIYYFGAAIFAVLFHLEEELHFYGEKLLGFLRKEGVKKAHIGMCSCSLPSPLESALTALDEAYCRGPYSFCDYATLCSDYIHPLAAMPKHIEKSLFSDAKKQGKFCVILFEEAGGQERTIDSKVLKGENVLRDGAKSYVVLAHVASKAARDVALETIEDMAEKGIHLSAGISYYPHRDFTKKAVLLQAQKALCHTSFYGPLTATVFDATSLNVSGDIYYGEGNYIKACKEYRIGCQVDEKNINILNSLGVALAMMGKVEALTCFKKALELDSGNFMALYNKGLHYVSRDKRDLAIATFKKARKFVNSEQGGLREELESRLGILYALEGNFKEALALLIPYAEKNREEKSRLAYFIGKSFFEMKKYKKARMWLQKASAFMASSPELYSVLGYVYCKTDQMELALSLSYKAVRMDSAHCLYKMRLAEVLYHSGELQEATVYCRKLMRVRSTKEQARQLLAKIYSQQGQHKKALRLG